MQRGGAEGGCGREMSKMMKEPRSSWRCYGDREEGRRWRYLADIVDHFRPLGLDVGNSGIDTGQDMALKPGYSRGVWAY
jgi:hypothetical protein